MSSVGTSTRSSRPYRAEQGCLRVDFSWRALGIRENLCASVAEFFGERSNSLRRRALRPQLKRDPLGAHEPSMFAMHPKGMSSVALMLAFGNGRHPFRVHCEHGWLVGA